MYVPEHFAATAREVDDLLDRGGAFDLITFTSEGLVATTLPLFHDSGRGTLRGHLARNNKQWAAEPIGEALVIARGPDAYIPPGWYASTVEHGRVVPTWNYLTVHVYGPLSVHDDPVWLEAHLRELTDLHEHGMTTPWSVDDPPEGFIAGMVRAVVGIEITITRREAKAKFSQNRPADDIDGVVRGLVQRGDIASARKVEAHRPR